MYKLFGTEQTIKGTTFIRVIPVKVRWMYTAFFVLTFSRVLGEKTRTPRPRSCGDDDTKGVI